MEVRLARLQAQAVIDEDKWECINEVFAGLNQLLQDPTTKDSVLACVGMKSGDGRPFNARPEFVKAMNMILGKVGSL